MLQNVIALSVLFGGVACLWLAKKNNEIMYSTFNNKQEIGLELLGRKGTRFIYYLVGIGLLIISILLFIGKIKI